MSYTKVKWHRGSHNSLIVYDADGWAIANAMTYHGHHQVNEAKSNANLMAAAPELLEALEMLKTYVETGDTKPLDMRKVYSAIAKAKGY